MTEPAGKPKSSEKIPWLQKTADWAKKRRAAALSAGPLTKKGKIMETPENCERKATCEWLIDLDNAATNSWSLPIKDWIPAPKAWDADFAEGEQPGRLVVLTNDELQVQLCGEHFMERQLGTSTWCFNGPFHRRANDFERALAKARKLGALHRALMWLNIAYGPWKGGANMKNMEDTVYEAIQKLTADEAIVNLFWPFVRRARGWHRPEETDRAARIRWLANLPSCRVFAQSVPVASTSRWMSAVVSLKFHAPFHYDRLFIISIMLCFQGLHLPLLGIEDRGVMQQSQSVRSPH